MPVYLFSLILLGICGSFLWLEKFTHIAFFQHMAAIPLEILFVALLFKWYLNQHKKKKRETQSRLIKNYLFRTDMRNLIIMNFQVLKYPEISMSTIRKASLHEMMQLRKELSTIEYNSLKELEPIFDEYLATTTAFHRILSLALENEFESIFQDMIYILHFIQDIRLFRQNNPNGYFIMEAKNRPELMLKVKKILKNGVENFLDYAIELKKNQPDAFVELMEDYLMAESMNKNRSLKNLK